MFALHYCRTCLVNFREAKCHLSKLPTYIRVVSKIYYGFHNFGKDAVLRPNGKHVNSKSCPLN